MTTFNDTIPEIAALGDTPVATVLSQDTITDATTIHDNDMQGWATFPVALTDDMTANESLLDTVIFQIFETEATGINDTADVFKRVDIVLVDGTSIADTPLSTAVFNMLIDEGFVFTIVLNFAGQEFVCWVANADTFAHGQYDNFDFNSMCRIGARYYGAKEDGIYQLDGDTDAGVEIPWFMALPIDDAGTALFKRVPRVYMGIKNDGALYIRTLTDGGAQRVYLFRRRAESLAGAGETLGRGVKSRYWGYDLIGVDGSDFELDQIEFFPVVLGRRVP